MIKKVKLYLKIVEPLWSKHNLALGEGILSTTSTMLEIFLSSIVYELKNHYQWHATPCLRNLLLNLYIPNLENHTIKKINDHLFNIFWTKRSELYDEFRSANYKVSITSDIWSAGKHNMSYFSVTAHWITQDTNFGT
jgi:hypothetical protein